ncbi:TPA: hypothetical protein ACHJYJ_002275 [Enterococcus faecalis]
MEINKIEDNSPAGKYFFHTLSGSRYILMIEDSGNKWIKRLNANVSLRKDIQKIDLQKIGCLELGKQGLLILEPLGFGNVTLRITTHVIKIYQ